MCSALAHWAPVLAEASYLPFLTFPFTLLFANDDLACFETLLTVLCYWGHSWHALHPLPPAHLANAMSALLTLHETKLAQFLVRFDVNAGLLAWELLSTLFSQVCGRAVWCALMDFLFSHFVVLPYLILTPVALLRDLKALVFSCDTKEKILAVCQSQQNLRVEQVTQSVCEMYRATPGKYFAAVATSRHAMDREAERAVAEAQGWETAVEAERVKFNSANAQANANKFTTANTANGGNANGGNDNNGLSETEEAQVNIALSYGHPKFPLPHGPHYPVYDGFPKALVDLQIKERERVLAMQREVDRRSDVLQELQEKVSTLEEEHAQWKEKHSHAQVTTAAITSTFVIATTICHFFPVTTTITITITITIANDCHKYHFCHCHYHCHSPHISRRLQLIVFLIEYSLFLLIVLSLIHHYTAPTD
jgi:hypothetical protein